MRLPLGVISLLLDGSLLHFIFFVFLSLDQEEDSGSDVDHDRRQRQVGRPPHHEHRPTVLLPSFENDFQEILLYGSEPDPDSDNVAEANDKEDHRNAKSTSFTQSAEIVCDGLTAAGDDGDEAECQTHSGEELNRDQPARKVSPLKLVEAVFRDFCQLFVTHPTPRNILFASVENSEILYLALDVRELGLSDVDGPIRRDRRHEVHQKAQRHPDEAPQQHASVLIRHVKAVTAAVTAGKAAVTR